MSKYCLETMLEEEYIRYSTVLCLCLKSRVYFCHKETCRQSRNHHILERFYMYHYRHPWKIHVCRETYCFWDTRYLGGVGYLLLHFPPCDEINKDQLKWVGYLYGEKYIKSSDIDLSLIIPGGKITASGDTGIW